MYHRTVMIQFANTECRRETGNIKWDLQGPLPFGIADMDIASPPCIIEALQQRLEHPYFGYAFMTQQLRQAICNYLVERHRVLDAQPAWLHALPGCVPAFTLAARSVCQHSEDEIMLCTPVYPPMLHCHEDAGCRLISVPFVRISGQWEFDWEAMEAAVTPHTRMFLLCNPHNPLGRVWSPEDILKLGEFCNRHKLVLCSDEIHCDLVLDENKHHTSVLTLPEEIRKRVIMLSAPSKTFNIAGICFTFMAIPNEELLKTVQRVQGHTLPTLSVFAYAAALAAYREGWSWHAELLSTLRKHYEILKSFISRELPMLQLTPLEATYLAWIDCSALGVESPHEFFLQHAGIYLDNGANFGAPQCVRFNFATSPTQLQQGLEAMHRAILAHREKV